MAVEPALGIVPWHGAAAPRRSIVHTSARTTTQE
jgi:hypothetical protein